MTQRRKIQYGAAALGAALLGLLAVPSAQAQIDATNWGNVTAPVFGSTDPTYTTAELTAGPNKFGSYFAGVLPNGRKVTPAGLSTQIGMNPLGSTLTTDGKYLITTNDDERDGGTSPNGSSAHTPDNGSTVVNQGSYSLSVIDTSTMKVVSQISAVGKFFIGLQATGSGPYTVYASGGGDQDVKVFTVSAAGLIAGSPKKIAISPITPTTQGFVSHYVPGITDTS
jgi:YVTN family beta-propeller protein